MDPTARDLPSGLGRGASSQGFAAYPCPGLAVCWGAEVGYVSAIWVQGREQTEMRVSISCWEAFIPGTLWLPTAPPVLILKGWVRNQGETTVSRIIWEVAINSQVSSECKIFERLYYFKNIE